MRKKVGVVGLGYVGLPVAVAFGEKLPVIGYDVDARRIAALQTGRDETGEHTAEELARTSVTYTDDPARLAECDFIIVTVPTPVDEAKRPDLRALLFASETVGKHMQPGTIVVYESTVYPGATEEVCVPALERSSGKRAGEDFLSAILLSGSIPGTGSAGSPGSSRSSPARTGRLATRLPTCTRW